jgi:Rrf2 family transcriptional regulator, cysteine metabolism repressor
MISIRSKVGKSFSTKRIAAKSGFLNLSQKADYGIFLMAHLAANQAVTGKTEEAVAQTPVSLRDVSKKHHLSFYFLQKIAVDLRKAGLIKAIRGKSGGYVLNKKPELITVKMILEALEGPIALTSCMGEGSAFCAREDGCFIRNGLSDINNVIVKSFENYNLSNFLNTKVNEK